MEQTKTQTLGGKEIGLLELEKHSESLGYLIPEFHVLESLDEKRLREIAENFSGQKVIARSNSIMENSEFGFDGIYDSVIVEKCNFEGLRDACKKVLKSLNSERAVAYRKKAAIFHDSMRVIVQRFIGRTEGVDCKYFVIETSINAQGDISIATSRDHDFINQDLNWEEFIFDKGEETIASTTSALELYLNKYAFNEVKNFSLGLQKIFGPVALEGAILWNIRAGTKEIYLFQRRLLSKEIYQAPPENVPAHYDKKDILFSSKMYRGSGKIEKLPVIVMPRISDGAVELWERELIQRKSQLKADFILFIETMHLGIISTKILNDYSCLSGAKLIVSSEEINFMSHSFKVASLARIPFVSTNWENLRSDMIEDLDIGSIFFTGNRAVFCLDQKNAFENVVPSKAKTLKKGMFSGFSFNLSKENKSLKFSLDLDKLSFNEFAKRFQKLLQDISGEIWYLKNNHTGNIGFVCTDKNKHSIEFSGWANYMKREGNLSLQNFSKSFLKENFIEWSLIEKIAKSI